MAHVPASSHGSTFNGGTITQPLVIDLTADLADRTALDVIQPATFGFSTRPFRFRQTDFAYLQMETTGVVSSAGNNLSSGGANVLTQGGNVIAAGAATRLLVQDGSGNTRLDVAGSGSMAFFGGSLQSQAGAIANAAGGVVIDAEARAALNSLLAAMRLYGLLAT